MYYSFKHQFIPGKPYCTEKSEGKATQIKLIPTIKYYFLFFFLKKGQLVVMPAMLPCSNPVFLNWDFVRDCD